MYFLSIMQGYLIKGVKGALNDRLILDELKHRVQPIKVYM
jgi:hypothetical protein